MNTGLKQALFIITVVIAIYAFLPKTIIGLLGSFCIGWTLADIARYIFKD